MPPVFLGGDLNQGKYDMGVHATGMPNTSISNTRTPTTKSVHRGSQETRILHPGWLWGKSLILTELQFTHLQKDVIKSDDLQRLSVLTVRESIKLLYGNHKGTWVINSGIEEVFLLLREIISKKL